MLGRLCVRPFALVRFSCLREASEAVRNEPALPSKLVPETEHFKLFASCFRLMYKEFTQEEPDTASLTYLLDRFRDSGAIPASSYDQQLTDLYMRFRALATRGHSFLSTSDFCTVVWRLQQARISMDPITMQDLVDRIAKDVARDENSVPVEALVRALEACASMNIRPETLLFETVLPAMRRMPRTQEQVLRVLVAMCIFNCFTNSAQWTDLLALLSPDPVQSYSAAQRLLMLQYILSVHYPYLLSLSINQQPVKRILTPDLGRIPTAQTSVPVVDRETPVVSLHEEVKFVLAGTKTIFPHCTEHFNVGNGFLVDFAQEKSRICLDIDAPHHYYRPKLGSSYLEQGNLLLNGFTVMKYRTLTQAGWQLVQIPFFQWRNFHDEAEKRLFLTRKLRTLRPISLPKVRIMK